MKKFLKIIITAMVMALFAGCVAVFAEDSLNEPTQSITVEVLYRIGENSEGETSLYLGKGCRALELKTDGDKTASGASFFDLGSFKGNLNYTVRLKDMNALTDGRLHEMTLSISMKDDGKNQIGTLISASGNDSAVDFSASNYITAKIKSNKAGVRDGLIRIQNTADGFYFNGTNYEYSPITFDMDSGDWEKFGFAEQTGYELKGISVNGSSYNAARSIKSITRSEKEGVEGAEWLVACLSYEPGSSGANIPETIISGFEPMTFYADIEPVNVNITFDKQGGTGNTMDVTARYGERILLPSAPTKTGYEFTGWFTAASGGREVTRTTKSEFTEDTTLYAHWKSEETKKIRYYANGGSFKSGSASTTILSVERVSNERITLPNGSANFTDGSKTYTLSRSGYTFTGWNTKSDGTGTSYAAGSRITVSNDKTLYAQWKDSQCKVTITYNGVPKEFKYDKNTRINVSELIRMGTGDNSTDDYKLHVTNSSGMRVANNLRGTQTIKSDTWYEIEKKPVCYTVTWEIQCGSAKRSWMTEYEQGAEISFTRPRNTKMSDGYIFLCWEDKNGNKVDSAIVTGNVTYRARVKKVGNGTQNSPNRGTL